MSDPHFLFTFGVGLGQFCIAVVHLTNEGAFIYARLVRIPQDPVTEDGQYRADGDDIPGYGSEPVSESWFLRINAPVNEFDDMWDAFGQVERDAPAPMAVHEDVSVRENVEDEKSNGASDVDGHFQL